MIYGIGTDIIEIERIEKACKNERFIERCFTKLERELIQQDSKKAAGNFAVKEAVAKVFGTGFRGIHLTDIEVLRDSLGKPYIHLYQSAKEMAKERNIITFHVSISNTKEYATAFVIGEIGEIKL